MNRRELLALGIASVSSIVTPSHSQCDNGEFFPLSDEIEGIALYGSWKAEILKRDYPEGYLEYLISALVKHQQSIAYSAKIPSGWELHRVCTIANEDFVQTTQFLRRVS